MAYINVNFNLAEGETKVIPLNRGGYPTYSIQIDSGVATAEGTLQQVNRGNFATWFPVDDAGGTSMTALAFDTITQVASVPLEAIRITANGGSGPVLGRLLQSGQL